MSKVKIQGNASGTGTLTISAPNTDTDRSLTLPDTAGEFVTADASGNVGIGTSSPESKLHVYVDNVRAPSVNADDFIIEKTGDTGLSILSTTTGRIYFGDAASSAMGSIRYVHTDDSMRFEANNSERMRIDSSGNVGIGTTSPSCLLQLETDGPVLRLTSTSNTNASVIQLGDTDDEDVGYIRYENNGNVMRFGVNVSERMRIDSSGNLLVGTTSTLAGTANAALHIKGGGGGPYVIVSRNNDSSGGANQILFLDGSGDTCGSITSNATSNTTSYNTSSDYRLKQDVAPMSGAIGRLQQLNPCTWNWVHAPEVSGEGFLAHEAQEVVPEAVTGTHNEVDDDGNPIYQGIDQSKLVPLLTGALQEAIAKIETLETTVADLTTRIETLENA